MSIRTKLGQLFMMDFRYWGEDPNKTPIAFTEANKTVCNLFKEYNLGGFILFKENIQNNHQTISLLRDLQGGNKTPLFFATDQEGGRVHRLIQGTSGCGNMAIAATNNPKNSYQMSKILGDELHSLGININFAPVIDVNSNKNNPVIGVRSYSDDPKTVTKYARESIKGLTNADIINCVKHFPGHGDTAVDSHVGNVILNKNLDELEKIELYPFRELVKEYDMVMSAHISVPSIDDTRHISISNNQEIYIPATLSHKVITKLLKEEIGFTGLVITDAMDMKAITTHFDPIQATKLAILAGVDIVLMPTRIWCEQDIYKLEKLFIELENEYVSNKSFTKAIDIAYDKIIKFKDAKISQNPVLTMSFEQQLKLANKVVSSIEHQNIAYEISKQSTTIVKNNGLIPYNLKDQDTILIIDFDSERLKDFLECLSQLLKQKNLQAKIMTKNINDDNLPEDINLVDIVILVSENLKQYNQKYSYLTSLASKKTINIAAIKPYDINYIDNIENYVCIYGATSIDQTNYTKVSLKINIMSALENIFDINLKLESVLPITLY
ncbi:beta-N-acetylhexosaminidase [Allofrancisella inopinata]|uniref:glycoside hydrolase family 3 protein n=1 Tax=Allofrancisella inopinata TaxID=1085647 RepID=UPI00106390E3|nr:glycoside hydrolase family 3 protein [Allofrancisella inopinata]TDT69665.1 beta-N-acetylhexosaminidase [Allofrancisella inopinata]